MNTIQINSDPGNNVQVSKDHYGQVSILVMHNWDHVELELERQDAINLAYGLLAMCGVQV